MDFGLRGKVALICAGSKGLGRAVALELAREGAHIALCARGEDAIAQTCQDIQNINSDGALGFVCDLAEPDEIDAFVAETTQTFGRSPDIVVWNAGGPAPGPVLSLDRAAYQRGVDLHLHGAMHLFRRTVPQMSERGFGRVIAVTSIAVKQPLAGLGVSNAVRAGLHGAMKTLAAEVARHGVTVNCVLPGFTNTERLRGLAAQKGIAVEDFAKDVPAGRVGRPEEFAAAVAFLASERASYINGVSLTVDGGYCAGLL